MEKLNDGGSVFRTEESEERVQRQFDQHKQRRMEKLYGEMERDEGNSRRGGRRASRKRWSQAEVEELQTGADVFDAVEGSLQPDEIHVRQRTTCSHLSSQ